MKPIVQAPAHRCHLAIIPEDDGSFSAIVLNLPGSGSCGDSEAEAISNAQQAVAAVIESYTERRQEIPWLDSSQYAVPEGAKQKWILVNG